MTEKEFYKEVLSENAPDFDAIEKVCIKELHRKSRARYRITGIAAVLVLTALTFALVHLLEKRPAVPVTPTQAPTEAPTEAPIETPTLPPGPTDPAQATSEPATKPPEEPSANGPTEAPPEVPTEIPTEIPTEEPTGIPTDAPTEGPTDAPAVTPVTPGEMTAERWEQTFAAVGLPPRQNEMPQRVWRMPDGSFWLEGLGLDVIPDDGTYVGIGGKDAPDGAKTISSAIAASYAMAAARVDVASPETAYIGYTMAYYLSKNGRYCVPCYCFWFRLPEDGDAESVPVTRVTVPAWDLTGVD